MLLRDVSYAKPQTRWDYSHHMVVFCSVSILSSTKIEKEKREHAKQHGMIRTEITGAEIAEEMEKERRIFQLQMCEVSMKNCQHGFPMPRLLTNNRTES